jgi:hypothetical protein
MDNAHSNLGASGAYRWMRCPGSVALSKDIPDKESPYAREGSAAHYLSEQAFGSLPPVRPSILYSKDIGKPCPKWPDITITQDMIDAIDIYWEHAMEVYLHCGKHVAVEQPFNLNWLHAGLWGTNDLSGYDEQNSVLYVSDYKHGAGVSVEVVNNPQLMYYALGALGPDNPLKVETVILSIIQPRAYHPDGAIRQWETTPDVIYKWANTVLSPAVAAVESPDAPLVTGDHCKFCKAMAVCPAVAEKSLSVAQQEFSVVDGKTVVNIPAPEMLTIDQMVRVLGFSKS